MVIRMKKIYFFILFIFTLNSINLYANSCAGYADIVQPLLPAVVNISVIGDKKSYHQQMSPFPGGPQFEEFNKFFERFGNGLDEYEDSDLNAKPSPSGSGFIISSEGYIVTNYHVVDEAEKIVVTLSNDEKLDAKLIGFDNRTDLALLKIESKKPLAFVNFGNSDESRVGDAIITIGNPFGLGSTVTSGIISAQARDISPSATNIIDNFIQTDAAINRGNSGGPMFNTKGEVIGINFAIVSPTGNNIGIGFAIPASIAKPIVEQIKKDGKVHHGWIGVAIQATDDISESLGLKEGAGALVSSIIKGGPAEKSGIEIGDVILKFDGKEISTHRKLSRIVAETTVGKKVKVELMSKGKPKNINLVVEEMNTDLKRDALEKDVNNKDNKSLYGMSISSITPDLRKNINIPSNINGLIVLNLDRKSVAAKHGIRKGDIIISANQKALKTPEDLINIIQDSKKNNRKSIMILINRVDGHIFLSLPVDQ